MNGNRTPAKKKGKELAKYLRTERPDYAYLKSVFQCLRRELEVEVSKSPKRLPYVPSEEEIRRYYQAVWQTKDYQDMMIIKTLLYIGVRVSELISIRLDDVDYDSCQIMVNQGKGKKDCIVPFPESFKELLAMHADKKRSDGATYLFESSWKKKYTDRGIRKILSKYSDRSFANRTSG